MVGVCVRVEAIAPVPAARGLPNGFAKKLRSDFETGFFAQFSYRGAQDRFWSINASTGCDPTWWQLNFGIKVCQQQKETLTIAVQQDASGLAVLTWLHC
jgi:hypothetical protein